MASTTETSGGDVEAVLEATEAGVEPTEAGVEATEEVIEVSVEAGVETEEVEGVEKEDTFSLSLEDILSSDHFGSDTELEDEIEGIRNVWESNMLEEFVILRKLVKTYTFIAMDTEFPGFVVQPVGDFQATGDYQYQNMRANVDVLRLIQLGLTLMDEHGQRPPGISTWQFNFKFSLETDMHSVESINLLKAAGIQFKEHDKKGIDPLVFSEYFITSGFVLLDTVTWLTFHGGYDFGYLVKILLNTMLPEREVGFFELLNIFFKNNYDIKELMRSCNSLRGGLQDLATQLKVERVGVQHQAGSDSLVTGLVFFKMKEVFFGGRVDAGRYSGILYGFGLSYSVPYNVHVAPFTPAASRRSLTSNQLPSQSSAPKGPL